MAEEYMYHKSVINLGQLASPHRPRVNTYRIGVNGVQEKSFREGCSVLKLKKGIYVKKSGRTH